MLQARIKCMTVPCSTAMKRRHRCCLSSNRVPKWKHVATSRRRSVFRTSTSHCSFAASSRAWSMQAPTMLEMSSWECKQICVNRSGRSNAETDHCQATSSFLLSVRPTFPLATTISSGHAQASSSSPLWPASCSLVASTPELMQPAASHSSYRVFFKPSASLSQRYWSTPIPSLNQPQRASSSSLRYSS